MTTSGESGALFDMIEEFAVEDDGDIARLVEDRLLAVCQPDDAQPPRA